MSPGPRTKAEHRREAVRPPDRHHFRESIADGRLSFDYRIHPGPTSTHNALRMMEAYGFPEEVVVDARRTVERIDRRWRDDVEAGSRHDLRSDGHAHD